MNSAVVDFTATLPQGYFNATSYASALTLAVNSVSGVVNSYTVSYNNPSLKLTIPSNLSNTFHIRYNNTMLKEMGWSPSQLNTFITTKTCDWVCDISGSHYVDIQANFNTKLLLLE